MSLLTRSFLLLFLCLTATKVTIYAYNGNPNAPIHRRNWINGFAAASGSLAVAASTNIHAANAVISSKYCAYGTGQGCEDLAEGNEFIKELQARSAANKEAIQLVRLERTRKTTILPPSRTSSKHFCHGCFLPYSLKRRKLVTLST